MQKNIVRVPNKPPASDRERSVGAWGNCLRCDRAGVLWRLWCGWKVTPPACASCCSEMFQTVTHWRRP